MSYLRNKTRPQGDRPIYHNQDNFGGGLNIDDPATDVDVNEVINGENYIWNERYGDGRSGTVEVADLPGSGDLHGKPFYHPKEKCLIFHRGTQLWRWDGVAAVEIFDYDVGVPRSIGEDGTSNIVAFGDGALLYSLSGDIYLILISNDINKYLPINKKTDNRPRDLTQDIAPVGTNLQSPYKYKYAYTFSLIIDSRDGTFITGDRLSDFAVVVWESPPVPSDSTVNPDESFFRLMSFATPIDDLNTQTLKMGLQDELSAPAFGPISHVTWYRTVDLGQEGADNENINQFGWVGDALIDKAVPPNTQLIDNKTSERIQANILTSELRLQNIDWVPLRTVDNDLHGSVSEGFVFAATRNGKELVYSQRVLDQLIGYHAGFQSHVFNDGIRVMGSTPDVLTLACNNTTHICSLPSVVNSGVLQSEFVLDHFDEIDTNIGVQDVGSFLEVEQGVYVAICSDKSVRIWQGNGWSADKALDKVGTSINRAIIGKTTAVYSDGAYFLWMDTQNSGFADTCLRLSLKRSSGKGWDFYTGDNWSFPLDQWGAFNADSFLVAGGINLNLTFVIDRSDNKIYWMETFNGPTGKSINGFDILAYFADKVSSGQPNGYDIKCRVRPREVTGARESFNIIHQESHAYMRDLVDPDRNPIAPPITYSELKVDARAYVDGLLADVETAGEVNPGDDIQFWYKVSGSRIAIEFESNRSGHRLVRNDSRFRVQDILRPGRGPANNVSSTFQSEFQDGLSLWMFTRPSPYLDRISRSKISSNGVTTVTAPDGRSKGVTLTGVGNEPAPYIKENTTVFDAFTYNVWIKTPTLSGNGRAVLLKVNGGAQGLTIYLTDANIISTVEFGGSVSVDDPTTAPGNVNGWSQFIFVRRSGASVMNVYQNDAFKGTLPVNTSFGGGSLEIGGAI